MPLPAKSSAQTEKIMTAAAQLFARQGYHGTSTREIARLADVSENTLFRHFDRKEDVFWSALRTRCAAIKLRRDMVDGMRYGHAPEVVLPKIIEFLIDILHYSPDVLRLIAVAFLEMHSKADEFCDEYLTPGFSAISKYFAESARQGRVRDLDPAMVTAALTTMVLAHPWFSRQAADERSGHPDRRAAEHAYTHFWLDVLRPRRVPGQREAPLASSMLRR